MLTHNVGQVITALRDLSTEMRRLFLSARDGDLTARGNDRKIEGEYAELIQGVNSMLDAVS